MSINRNKNGRKVLLALFLSLVIALVFPNYPHHQAEASPILGDDMEDVSDWTLVNSSNGLMTRYAGASQVLQGSYSMNFRVTDNNNGVNDAASVYKAYSPNLNVSSHDVMSLWIQTDTLNPYLEVQLTDSDGTVSKMVVSNAIRGAAEIKANKWYQVFWHFKENIGAVSGGDGVMNYAAISRITLSSTDGRPTYMKTAQTNFYIDDLNFYADSDLYSGTQIDAMDSTSAWLTTSPATLASSSTQVKQGAASIKFTAANNNNGIAEYPSLYRANVNYDLSGSYELTYWIKPTQNLTFFNVRITDTDFTSEEFTLARMFPAEGGTLLANRWYKGRILFREDPGTITGGNGIMNFDALKEIVFVTRDTELPIGVNTDMYIDDLQAVKYNDRVMLDAFDSTAGWTATPGSSVQLNATNYRDASKAAVVFTAPNNNDGLENDYFAIKSLSANLSAYDVLSFWILVSKETDKMIFSMVDADGTTNYIRMDSILWGSQLIPGKWVHIEWPFKTVSDEISGSDAVMNYTNITKFQVIVNDNQMVKGITGNSFSFDNLEAMTAREWTRSTEEVPMLAPTANDYAADRFQIGMYQGSNVQPEKAFQDMVKHGVDLLITHVGQRNDVSTMNAGLARKLGFKIVRSSFPVANNNSLAHSGLDTLASSDSAQTNLYDPNNNTVSYLNANELEVYWPNYLQSAAAADYSYLANKTRANDSLLGVRRLTSTHHINYLWYDTGEDLPWFMDWSTLGNYGGFQWTDRLKETAQRMGKTNVINTNSWSPSNLLTAMSDRNYQHVGLAPLNLDAMADFKDSLWTNFEGGLNGIAFYIYDGSDDFNKWNFVDDDGNPMNDRRWAAVSDMSKQVRATEGKPYVELTYPRSYEVVEKGSVSLSAMAAPSGAAIASVNYEYNDGTNDSWTTIGTSSTSPYTVAWNTSGLNLAKKYMVRARSYDGTNYSSYDVSSFISLVAVGGPVISNMALSSNPTNGATSLVLTSTATDSAQAISQVQYYVDTVQKPGQGAVMTASDGTFNSLSEGATATIAIPALAATVPILIDDMNDISDWSGSASRNIEANLLRLDVSNNNNGSSDILTAIKDYGAGLQNLSNLDTLSFWLKDVTANLTQLQVKLIDSDGTILQASLPTYYGSSSFPIDIWKNIRWSFRENYDSISGGNGVFDYSNVKAIEFDVDDSTLPVSGALQKIYIDQIRVSAETRWQEETSPIVYVRAKDSAGNWGPTQSIKVNVTKSSTGDTQGPAIVVAGTNPHGITDGLSSFLLTANVDDGIDNHGGSQVVAAEYFIDSTGANGTGTAMGAIDGSFDAMSESVIATISAAAWAENSKHIFYIHGKDAAGNWGPFYTESIIKTAAQGPRIQNAAANPSPTQGSTTVTLRAIADETDTGWGTIAAGEYFVDTVGFEGTGTSMTSYDGAFSAKKEQIMAQINITGWSSGFHTVYVHAKDSRGKWGALKPVTVLKN